jgi:regulation of enolase protein 1 (concanavalin A-like superfamily)
VSGTSAVTVNGLSAPPTVATAAKATPNPLTGTTATLSVLGADDGGESNLTYAWSVTGTPPATVFFAANGTNAAKNTTATFTKAGVYNLLATITDGDGQSATSAVTVTVTGLFTAATKVGTFSPTPSASVSSGTYTVTGAGSLATGSSTDNFYYYNAQVTGDADLIARVVSLSTTNSAARGGIMVRNSTANNSVYSGIFLTGSSTISSAVRTASGNSTGTTVSGIAVPHWLKISRRGTTLTTYRSSDGITWTQVRSDTISSLGSTVYFGLVASRSSGSSNTVKFDNVSLLKVAAPTIATPAAVSPRPVAGTTATLKVLGASYAGESGLTYTWSTTGTPPAAVSFTANGTNAAKTTAAMFTAPGTYDFQVTIRDGAGLTTTSSVRATVSFGLFNASVDVGSPALAGSLSVAGSTYTLQGGGADVWGTSDQFRYAYNSLAGDGTIVARVTGMTNTNGSAKAGVMFRDSAAANAAYAYVWVSPTNQVKFETRTANGASSAYSVVSPTLTGSVSVKLLRAGSSFAAYYSTDGSTWTQLGTTQTITMATQALVGLAVTSHNTASLNTAVFDQVSINAAAPTG